MLIKLTHKQTVLRKFQVPTHAGSIPPAPIRCLCPQQGGSHAHNCHTYCTDCIATDLWEGGVGGGGGVRGEGESMDSL